MASIVGGRAFRSGLRWSIDGGEAIPTFGALGQSGSFDRSIVKGST
jgi:hypothetical protein